MESIIKAQKDLTQHPLYQTFDSLKSIQHFMRYHVFAVWDFMSLLKSLQRQVTCVNLPWRPSPYSADMVRLINQIVLGEESDVGPDGKAISHFDLYLKGMEEVGASTSEIRDFITHMDFSQVPFEAREFVQQNIDLAQNGHVVEVAASFFFGREKLIPDMFQTIVDTLKKNNVEAPTFLYYLKRHIEVDGQEHGPMAMQCLEQLTGNDEKLKALSLAAGEAALNQRKQLWDRVLLATTNR